MHTTTFKNIGKHHLKVSAEGDELSIQPELMASSVRLGTLRYQLSRAILMLPSHTHHRRVLHIHEHQFEPIAQTSHVGVWLIHELKAIWNYFHLPRLQLRFLAGFEAQMEATRLLPVHAELVHRSLRVSIAVSGEPFI